MQRAFFPIFFIFIIVLGSVLAPDISLAQEESKQLTIPEITAKPGDTVTVPININDPTGVAGADITVAYNKDVLEVSEVKTTELTGDMKAEINTNTAGEIIVAMANAVAITGDSGSLINMVFVVNAGAEVGTEALVEFEEAAIYDENAESMDVNTQNGKVTVTCDKGDVNNDGDVNSGDAILTLRIAVGSITPTAWQECAADMDGTNGVTSADAIAILRAAAGLAAPGTGVLKGAGGQITVTVAEVYGAAGESVKVPVKVDKVYGLAGGDICIAYDKSVLRVVQVSSEQGMLLASNVSEAGLVRIAFASAGSLNGETLVEMQFDVLADDSSPLRFERAEFYNHDALPLISRSIDREFRSWSMPAEHNALLQNYPNPFNPETWIPYQLKEGSEVAIRIYGPDGRQVRTLDLGHRSAGFYVNRDRAAYWDGRNESGEEVSSGVYFYSIRAVGAMPPLTPGNAGESSPAGEFSAVRKLIVLK